MKVLTEVIKVWNQGKVLFVDKPEEEKGYLQVYDTKGTEIYCLPIDKGSNLSYILNVSSGSYLVTTVVQSGTFTEKIKIL